MLGEQHVFLAQAAGVIDQRQHQSVFAGSAKLINAGTFAVSRDWGCPARFLNCNGIPGDRVSAPDIAFAVMISINIERAICLHRPDSTERVSPSADQRPLRAGRIRRARIQEQEKNASQKNSQSRLCFHASDPVY